MDIPWEDLRLFLAVAEARSLSGAARALRLGQPTLSRRIAQLEESLDQRLFVRGAGGVTLTAAGERLVPPAARMAEWASEARRAAAGGERAPEGNVRIAAPPGVAFDLLAPLAATLRAQAPGIRLDLLAGIDYVNLARGEAELALRWRAPDERDLVTLAEVKVRAAVFAAKAYARRLERRFARPVRRRYGLADVDWIAWAPPYDQLPPNPQLAAAIPGFRPVFTSNDFLVQLAAVEAGVGAMMLGRAFSRRSRIALLTELDLDLGPRADTTLYVVAAKRMVDVPRVRAVARAILAEIDTAAAGTPASVASRSTNP
jgi:DNA-binding transcriptional LysR family regulator